MRTKNQIRGKLKELYNWKRKADDARKRVNTPFASVKGAFDIVDAQILVLKWALGYKTDGKNFWWCASCRIRHEGLKCPSCGSENAIEDEFEAPAKIKGD